MTDEERQELQDDYLMVQDKWERTDREYCEALTEARRLKASKERLSRQLDVLEGRLGY